jgi:hypothetical protein
MVMITLAWDLIVVMVVGLLVITPQVIVPVIGLSPIMAVEIFIGKDMSNAGGVDGVGNKLDG